jgi:hypothetical protein
MHNPADLLEAHGRLLDAARRRAAQLRADAIDEFWSGTGGATQRVMRSAGRLAASLARHQRLRTRQRA